MFNKRLAKKIKRLQAKGNKNNSYTKTLLIFTRNYIKAKRGP